MGLAFMPATPLSYVGRVSVDIYPFPVLLRALQPRPPPHQLVKIELYNNLLYRRSQRNVEEEEEEVEHEVRARGTYWAAAFWFVLFHWLLCLLCWFRLCDTRKQQLRT